MKKRYDVVALGELLIDFTQNGTSGQGNPLFEANPGGAPCNVLALLQKLGHRTAFIGKVGEDGFGRQLSDALKETGISTEGLRMDPEVHTTLAIVQTFADGDRDFSFYRKPGADMMLREDEVEEEIIRDSRIFHFGTLSMTSDPVLSATKRAIAFAEKHGLLISFDPNLREPLWDSLDDAKEAVRYGMEHCRILKISDNEVQWFTGEEDYAKAAEKISREYDIPLVMVSLGREGSLVYYGGKVVKAAPFLQESTIETTGAGDTFMGSMLHGILENGGLEALDEKKLQDMLRFANAAASLITTRRGALRVMPSGEEIEQLLRTAE